MAEGETVPKSLRTVYFDLDTLLGIGARARADDVSEAELVDGYVRKGLERPARDQTAAKTRRTILVDEALDRILKAPQKYPRGLYLDQQIDADLTARAKLEGISKTDLIRRYTLEGLSRPCRALEAYDTDP